MKRYFYDSNEQVREHLRTFLEAYNFGKRLRDLLERTPLEKKLVEKPAEKVYN